ncbi:hypothetical protein P4O66_021537 [Electrophorus voltai]|uniref:Uncharacterized protein n=1 Tax=Electrophorus voltai TaxID=2609070 RepID=A0AAD9E5K1_9TELE|nr:hypothetical protein P4O66_021537 [Electrophorus voltai]
MDVLKHAVLDLQRVHSSPDASQRHSALPLANGDLKKQGQGAFHVVKETGVSEEVEKNYKKASRILKSYSVMIP